MPTFLDDETFLLHTPWARRLYHEHAAALPIYDYHSHLPPGDIAADRRFDNLYDIWLAGDHYKWRAMRAAGVPERLCTGDASAVEKFRAFAAVVPQMLRNPLYHWTHLELRRTFGITELLDESTADSVWHRANEQLADLPVSRLLARANVAVVCTCDNPCDALAEHRAINAAAASADDRTATRVYPTFRPDAAMTIDRPAAFNAWVDRLAAASGTDCGSFDGFRSALRQRHEFFHSVGGRLSDHGLSVCQADASTDTQARLAFDTARAGGTVAPADAGRFRSHLMLFFGHLDAERGWTKQLHLGPLRDNRSRAPVPNTGFDSIGDWPRAEALSRYLDRRDHDGRLPKMVLYNANPADNYVFAPMAANFQDGITLGKIQFGSGWWFLDQRQGIEWQLDALSHCGLLSRFVGMLTDSRSFLSFPRHEYFRRILCNRIGGEVDRGELPADERLLGPLIADVCFYNSHRYFGMDVPVPKERKPG